MGCTRVGSSASATTRDMVESTLTIVVVSAQHSKVVNHEILIRMSRFGAGLGVWHMWVNAGKSG